MATFYWRGGTGTLNTANTANLAASATAATFTASRATTVLTVTAVASGTISVGDTVWHTNGTGVGIILSLGTGTGGIGTYVMDTSGTLSSRTMSSATIGAGPVTAADDLVFDSESNVGTATFTVTVAATAPSVKDFTASGLDATMTLALTAILTVAGNWSSPASNFAFSGTSAITFSATSSKTVSFNGVSCSGDFIYNGVGGTWALQSNSTTARSATLTNGTLGLGSFTHSSNTFSSNNANTRAIAFGTGKIVLSGGNNVTLWTTATATGLTFTGTPNIEASSVGSAGTRTINAGSTAGENETHAPPFKILGGTDTLSMNGSFGAVDFTGFAGTLGNVITKFYGSVTLASGMTPTGGGNTWSFAKTSGTQTITSATKVLDNPININGAGGTVTLADNLSITARLLTLTNGTLDLNGKTLTAGTAATASGTKNLTFNGGTLLLTATSATAFNNAQPTNFTTTAGTGTGTISMNNAAAKTFIGGGSTFNCKLSQDGVGTLTITGSNTFSDIANTVQPASILFTAGTTNTFTAFSLSGTSGNQITIGSVTAAGHTLSKASGSVTVSFCDISRSTATGGATWSSLTSSGNVDNGNNSGWVFTGSTYNVTQAETSAAADTPSSNATVAGTIAETATAADTQSAGGAFDAAVAETATALETVAAGLEVSDVVGEVATAADTASSVAVYSASLAESAPITDTDATDGNFAGLIAETAAALDTSYATADGEELVLEFASAANTQNALVDVSASVVEAAFAHETIPVHISYQVAVAETALAVETITVRIFRPTWFLSFAQVTPPPALQGPGNPGKLFGDFELKEVL